MNHPSSHAPTGDLLGRQIFGQYTIVRKLGEGGMGAVYQARQEAIDQDIAIKVLLSEAARSPEIVQRFHREAKVISMLSHPNIIRVFIFGRTEEGLLYLAMEFVNGRELREDLRGQPMDELRAIRIMKQACSALAEAHDLGIIHRDLKPDNILLTKFRGDNDFVKILDFGIAKITENEDSNQAKLTQAGIVYGTPEYLSPEQAQALKLDRRTDIYSLGVMLYEMMTGQVPFMADSPVKILTKHVFEEPRRPNEIAGGRIAPTMENIILKAMKKDPKERFDNALDMFRALVRREQELLSSKGLGADANWVPGGELTGMFQAIEVQDMPAQARTPQRGQLPSKPLHAHANEDNTVSMAMPQVTAATPAATQQDDGTRKLVLVVIGIGLVILIILLAVIAMLLLNR
jgi:serine/threonine-protein kinase